MTRCLFNELLQDIPLERVNLISSVNNNLIIDMAKNEFVGCQFRQPPPHRWEQDLMTVIQNVIFDEINSTSIGDIVLGPQVERGSPIKQSFKT
jgi:hypothetical protein